MNRSACKKTRRQPAGLMHSATPGKKHEYFKSKIQAELRRSTVRGLVPEKGEALYLERSARFLSRSVVAGGNYIPVLRSAVGPRGLSLQQFLGKLNFRTRQ